MLTKVEKHALRKLRYRSTITMSEEKFAKIAASGLFYPVLKPGQYWWGGSGRVKVRLTDAGEQSLREYRAWWWKVFFKVVFAVISAAAAIVTIFDAVSG